MTEIVETLDAVSGRYTALFCDLWGCLHDGVTVFPEAAAALQRYRRGGGRVVLVTNSPRPEPQVAQQLDTLGCPRDAWDAIATSGDSAQAALMRGVVGRKVFHLGPERDHAFFDDLPAGMSRTVELVPIEEAEGIACTGLVDDATETPDDYRAQLLFAKHRGLKLLCANPDIVVDRGDERVFCAGALAALYVEMGGQSLYFGKPHPPIYDLARRRLSDVAEVADADILAIGDGPGTDMAGAMGEGLDFLFVTGGLAAEDTGTVRRDDRARPDPTRLSSYLKSLRLSPAYAIGMLR